MKNLDEIKKRIRACLRTASNDGSTDGEIENALAFARGMMLRHNLSETDVAENPHEQKGREEVEFGRSTVYSNATNLADWESTLSHAIKKLIGTVSFYTNSRVVRMKDGTAQFDRKGDTQFATKFTWYGPAEDAADAAELFSDWSTIIIALSRLKYGGVFRGPGRSYCEGFANQLWGAMNRIEDAERLTCNAGTDLMVIDATKTMARRREEGRRWLRDECNIRLSRGRKRSSSGKFHAGAYADGQADGKNADFKRDVRKKIQ